MPKWWCRNNKEVKQAENDIDIMLTRIVISEIGMNPSESEIADFVHEYWPGKEEKMIKGITDSIGKVRNLMKQKGSDHE
jgi:hypothetical protein